MTKAVKKAEKESNRSLIRFSCSPLFYKRAMDIANEKGITLAELVKFSLTKEIDEYEKSKN